MKIKIIILLLTSFIFAKERYIIKNDYVIDNLTGLIWQRYSSPESNWNEAKEYCKKSRTGGFSDWRLPSIDELMTIVDKRRYAPSIYLKAFPDTKSDYYWTRTTNKKQPNKAWLVFFYYGYDYYYYKNNVGYSRCVRENR